MIGYSPWGCKESDTTEWLHFTHFILYHWGRNWRPTPVFSPGESYGQRSLVGHGPWGRRESDTTEVTEHAHKSFLDPEDIWQHFRTELLFSHYVMSNSLRPRALQHARLPCPSPSPGVCSSLCPLSWWCHPTISSSVSPFFSCPQSFPALGSFQWVGLFTWGSQSIGASASVSVLAVNIQGWFPLRWTDLISFLSKGLSRVFPSTTLGKHQIFSGVSVSEGPAHPTWSYLER